MMKIPLWNKTYNLGILKHWDFIDFASNSSPPSSNHNSGIYGYMQMLVLWNSMGGEIVSWGAATSEAAGEPQKRPHSKTPF